MTTVTIIVISNTIITILCLLIQAIGIKKGKYDSSIFSWIIWSTIFLFSFVIFYLEKGTSVMSSLLLVQFIAHLIMIPITYRFSNKKIEKEDKKLISISIIGFILWITAIVISKIFNIDIIYSTILGILGQIIADASGAIPYLRIVYKTPNRQPLSAWGLNLLIYPLTILGTILADESWTAYIFIGYGFVTYGSMFVLVLLGQRKIKN